MILGVNGLRLVGRRSGVGRVIEALLHNLGKLPHPFTEIRVYTPAPIDEGARFPPPVRIRVLPSRLPLALWEQLVLPWAHGSRDLLLCPSYVVPLAARCATFLIHHGSYEGYPQAFPLWTRLKTRLIYQLSARRATLVSTVSEHSKRDMVRFYGLDPENIHVVPDGVDTRVFRPLGDADAERLAAWRRQALGEDGPFILYVGRPSGRRNLPNLLAAFAALKRDRALPHKLVMIGTALSGIAIEPTIAELGLDRHVVRIGYLPHEEIAIAYNACELFVYPSAYEGFGMPVLEAMACGAPVIALDRTSVPEFAGGVACLLPDGEVETLRRGIERLLTDSASRARMRRDGPQRAAAYDWEIVTRRYIELMVSLRTR